MLNWLEQTIPYNAIGHPSKKVGTFPIVIKRLDQYS